MTFISATRVLRGWCLGAAVCGTCAVGAPAAGGGAAASVTPPVPAAQVAVLTAEQVIQILDQTVEWYRTLGTQQQNATQPSDLLILFANRQAADGVVGLAFEIARANAELLSSEATAGRSVADAASPEALDRQRTQLDAQRQVIEREMAEDRAATGTNRQDRAAKLPELAGELAMVSARRNLLDTMAEFVGQSDPKGAGANALKAHIDAIAASIPTSGAGSAAGGGTAGGANGAASAGAAAGAGGPGGGAAGGSGAGGGAATGSGTGATGAGSGGGAADAGLWQLGSDVLKLRGKLATLDVIDRRTAALADTFQKISAQPLAQLKAYTARSDALAAQADQAATPMLQDLRGEFDTLAWLFKQTSAILLPLSKEQVLLQQYRHNLASWRDATLRQYRDAWEALAVRVGLLAALLAVVFALAEVWRRAVLRYAHEARRRYQLLLVRRIVLWIAVACIIGLNVVTEIGTFATFAGLLTAGVAVAMQSVLVSVVGYFFLIGKYGIRVGDRIQIGAVVGEVIDLGLVRMHLMELNTQGPLGPTGRVVAFANLIVFQTSGGLFKQIPGVNLSWHETVLALPAVADYAGLKDELVRAIGGVVEGYRDEIARQTRELVQSTGSGTVDRAAAAVAQVHLRLVDGRMEALVRYPVHHEDAEQIDEQVAQALLKVIGAQNAKHGTVLTPER